MLSIVALLAWPAVARAEVRLPAILGSNSVLYNGMIAPLTPLRIRGVIWDQGEGGAMLAIAAA